MFTHNHSVNKALALHIQAAFKLEKAMQWKPKGIIYFNLLFIKLISYIMVYVVLYPDSDSHIMWYVGHFSVVLVLGTIVRRSLCTLYLSWLKEIPKIPQELLRDAGYTETHISKLDKSWFRKHT